MQHCNITSTRNHQLLTSSDVGYIRHRLVNLARAQLPRAHQDWTTFDQAAQLIFTGCFTTLEVM